MNNIRTKEEAEIYVMKNLNNEMPFACFTEGKGNNKHYFMTYQNPYGEIITEEVDKRVSDIVVQDGKAYFCDEIGFRECEFDESKVPVLEDMMRVVYVEPGQKPFITEFRHNLKNMQHAVEGLIEAVYPHEEDTCIICNEEAKLMGMEGNRILSNGSVIAGPFFVAGLTEYDFRGLTDDEIEINMKRYMEPQQITREEVEADMGFAITSW